MFINDRNKWYFIPVGNNLNFEFRFMKCKLEQYYDCRVALEFLEDKIKIDLKDFLVILNGCTFSNYSELIGKSHEAKGMTQWYALKDYDRIEGYIRKEAVDFVKFYSNVIAEIPKLRRVIKFCNSNGSPRTDYGIDFMKN
jgi:hypothetical protein